MQGKEVAFEHARLWRPAQNIRFDESPQLIDVGGENCCIFALSPFILHALHRVSGES